MDAIINFVTQAADKPFTIPTIIVVVVVAYVVLKKFKAGSDQNQTFPDTDRDGNPIDYSKNTASRTTRNSRR